jgi:ribosome-associated heat shock protein Hsp15
MRLDKWLWQARFFKTRSLATAEVAAGHVRLNGVKMTKPAHAVGTGDTLTFAQGGRVRLIRVLGLGLRRGPSTEAVALYLDLDDPRPAAEAE